MNEEVNEEYRKYTKKFPHNIYLFRGDYPEDPELESEMRNWLQDCVPEGQWDIPKSRLPLGSLSYGEWYEDRCFQISFVHEEDKFHFVLRFS